MAGNTGRCGRITDVAARADVSIKTVSRVLNDAPGVHPRTCLKVKPAMQDLGGVTVDGRGGARAGVAHLLGLGHRRIAHIAGDPQYLCSHERAAGYREALAEAGSSGRALVTPPSRRRPP